MTTTNCSTRTVANEGSSFILRIEFWDEDDAPAIPDTVRYRIDDPVKNVSIRAWTDVSLGSDLTNVLDLLITEDDTVSLDTRQYQRRLVTLEWDWETGHGTDDYEFYVKGLYGIATEPSD